MTSLATVTSLDDVLSLYLGHQQRQQPSAAEDHEPQHGVEFLVYLLALLQGDSSGTEALATSSQVDDSGAASPLVGTFSLSFRYNRITISHIPYFTCS